MHARSHIIIKKVSIIYVLTTAFGENFDKKIWGIWYLPAVAYIITKKTEIPTIKYLKEDKKDINTII